MTAALSRALAFCQGGRRRASGTRALARLSLVACEIALSALALLPDLDVIGFSPGVPYGAPWGHRGASHSLAAVLLVGALFGLATMRPGPGRGGAVRSGRAAVEGDDRPLPLRSPPRNGRNPAVERRNGTALVTP